MLWLRLRQRYQHTMNDDTVVHDERARAVIAAVQAGATSINAIARATNIGAGALRRKNRRGSYTGLVEQLIQAGILANDGGAIVLIQ